jgi:PAS domain S-box-containing protein
MTEKLHERELSSQELKEFMKFAVDNFTDAVFLIAENAEFHYVNKASCESLGYTEKELLNMSVADIDPWYDQAEWPHHWEEVKNSAGDPFETRHKRKDGSLIPVDVRTFRIIFGDDNFMCSFARDITVKTTALELISELEERFNIVFNASVDPVIILNDKGKILTANPVVCQALGYTKIELSGRDIVDFLDEESKLHFKEIFQSVLKNSDYQCTVTFVTKDGKELQVQCFPKIISDEHDEITSVVLIQKFI